MITLNDLIRIATGVLTPIAIDTGWKGTYYLCEYKSNVNPVYDRQMKVRENDLLFLKKRI